MEIAQFSYQNRGPKVYAGAVRNLTNTDINATSLEGHKDE